MRDSDTDSNLLSLFNDASSYIADKFEFKKSGSGEKNRFYRDSRLSLTSETITKQKNLFHDPVNYIENIQVILDNLGGRLNSGLLWSRAAAESVGEGHLDGGHRINLPNLP